MPLSHCSKLLCAILLSASACAAAPIPKLVEKDGRFALLVDGEPYLVLGAQVHNSSAWPAMLPKVWPAMADLHVNTVEIPVYWEQMEPEEGRFDYSLVDTLLAQARAHHLRLVLLWFGTWKNGSSHYMPEWLKVDPKRSPKVQDEKGRAVDSPSPFGEAAMAADTRAFTRLMTHLHEQDEQRTVIMVQVENESGTWGAIRDHSPTAEKAFGGPVPQELTAALKKHGGTWSEVFGPDAEEFFHAWAVAHYVGTVAAAGKVAYPLPLYTNAALRDPFGAKRGSYESGGPTDNVLDIWKAAAPAIDILAPDIYIPDAAKYRKVLDLYARPDNALLVPETGNQVEYARYFFLALGHGAIGWAPFGVDYTGISAAARGTSDFEISHLEPFALNYELVAPIARELAKLNYDGKVHATGEEKGRAVETLSLGAWTATVSYGLPAFGFGAEPHGNAEPIGRAFIAEIGPDEFLVGGFYCRVGVDVADKSRGKQRQFLHVQEVVAEDGVLRPLRILNGDETDYGLNFNGTPHLLRIKLATY